MVKVIPLGGLGEIGLNMMAIEHDRYILVIDAGLMFPDDFLPGIDLVIPNFEYLKENRDKVKAVVLTHGHEDHIGAMPYFLKEFPIPVYGTNFTLELLKEKLKEHYLPEGVDLQKVSAGDITRFGPFKVEYIKVNHSIPDGIGLAIETPVGILVHSGDFRIDPTPVDGQLTDLIRFAHFGEKGVLAFFSDSTNAEKDGFTMSERDVKRTLEDIFQSCRGRIIVASFASNISRIQQIVDLAVKFGRKVAFSGKSMLTNIGIAKQVGFMDVPGDVEAGIGRIHHFPDQEIAIVTTGSQGEPMSVLSRIARGQHKTIKVKQDDTIILSSRFIPGNEKAITAIINNLYRMGADVIYEKVSDIHTSGHARGEELKVMLSLVKPRFFVPIHGEFRHLVKHAKLALDIGIPDENVLIAEDGDVISFENKSMRLENTVITGRTLVDGKGVGDVGEMVLRDRRKLSGHGMVLALLTMDEQTGEMVHSPKIISRGFVFEDQSGQILEHAKCIVLEILDEIDLSSSFDWDDIESDIRKRLKRFFYKILERSPLIVPIINRIPEP
ncbi:MAG: ribonuclease J [Desulfobacterales bacterium]|nr:ribonuclease J [Desulfobacterales bacterium]